ncbi:MAG: N-6 DNA methylase [Candidatus Cloacimonetes bacterium]|nr:N-6 DNA methylase [Candidatus Cloacimonadota bacterium]
MSTRKYPLEAHTRTQINRRLENLGWNLDERDNNCNVFQEHAKTTKQQALLNGKSPDYILYESGTDIPIAVIEAKKPSEDLDKAINQAIEKYATPLNIPIVFSFNDTFVVSKHLSHDKSLKIDGEEIQDFLDENTLLRFINEGYAEILSAPKGINFNRDELLQIFVKTNNLLRKDGLRDGYERFSAFAEMLFLKLIDESERLKEHRGIKRTFPKKYCWDSFVSTYKDDSSGLMDFIQNSIWPKLHKEYGDIFERPITIKNHTTLSEVIDEINPINLTSTDTDIKGDAFEFFLKTVTNGNKDLGEYFTPRHIVRTIVKLVKPQYGESIYDPFCGTGGFLLEAFKYLTLRANVNDPNILSHIQRKTLFGNEITSTAKIAKMNLILFGDGHTNINEMDSLQRPVKEKYDIVLSNIPYSQKTEYGSFYPIPTNNGDSICMQHIWLSLKPGGRAAVIVPESFLYAGGVKEDTRRLIVEGSEDLSVISLPRGVFMPYTPTKTNVIYFKKAGKSLKKCYFFVVYNDGYELNTSRKPIQGDSDLKKLLSVYDEKKEFNAQSISVNKVNINKENNHNLRPFYYMEDIPYLGRQMVSLSSGIIKQSNEKIDPQTNKDKLWHFLIVSQNGVFLSDSIYGYEISNNNKEGYTYEYKVVHTGDIVYNPWRVNIGSIGIVNSCYDGMLVSPAYVVFKSINDDYPPLYILNLLKTNRYRRIIMNYSISSARATLPYSELIRIKIPVPSNSEIAKFAKAMENIDKLMSDIGALNKSFLDTIKNDLHL